MPRHVLPCHMRPNAFRADRALATRRHFLRSLGALVAGSSLIAACGPSTTAPSQPAAPPTSAPPAAGATPTAAAAAPAQATPGGLGTKPVSIEWWRRNYTAGSQN